MWIWTPYRTGVSVGSVIWIVVGVIVAVNLGYTLYGVTEIIDFILAVIYWPLTLLGVDFTVSLRR